MGGITQQALLERIDKFHSEVVDFADKFAQSTQDLKAATAALEASKQKWWVTYRVLISIVVVVVVLTVSALMTALVMRHTDMCLVTVGQKEVSLTVKSCKEVK